jgi:hypothetical protein
MGYRVIELSTAAVCLKKTRAWITGEDLANEPPGARARWLQDEAGLPKAEAEKLAKAIAGAKKADAILDALLDSGAAVAGSRTAAGRFVIQPGAERRRSGSHYTPRSLTGAHRREDPGAAPGLAASPAPKGGPVRPASEDLEPQAVRSRHGLRRVPRRGRAPARRSRRRRVAPRGPAPAISCPSHGPAHAAEDSVAAGPPPDRPALYLRRRSQPAGRHPRQALALAPHPGQGQALLLRRPRPASHGDSLVGLDLDQLTAFHWQPSGPRWMADRARAAPGPRRGRRRPRAHRRPRRRRLPRRRAREGAPPGRRRRRRRPPAPDRRPGPRRVLLEHKPKEREAERVRRRDLVAAWLASAGDPPRRARPAGRRLPRQGPRLSLDDRAARDLLGPPQGPAQQGPARGQGVDRWLRRQPAVRRQEHHRRHARRRQHLGWLKQLHPGSHGNADYSAHFFRRCDHLLGDHGTIGLLATNTIAQGDTRATGLQALVASGGKIYAATKRPCPGPATPPSPSRSSISRRAAATEGPQPSTACDVPEINSRLRAGSRAAGSGQVSRPTRTRAFRAASCSAWASLDARRSAKRLVPEEPQERRADLSVCRRRGSQLQHPLQLLRALRDQLRRHDARGGRPLAGLLADRAREGEARA